MQSSQYFELFSLANSFPQFLHLILFSFDSIISRYLLKSPASKRAISRFIVVKDKLYLSESSSSVNSIV